MRLLPRLSALVAFLLIASTAFADSSEDPLRFIPDKANLIVKIEQPRKLAEAITSLDAVKQAQQLAILQPFIDSPQARRIFEFIAFYERDLGAKWPELLDKLAGGGIALGAKIQAGDENPLLLAVQGTDKALVTKFVERVVYLFEEELKRGGSTDKVGRGKHHDIETLHFGKDIHGCRIGKALLVSNKLDSLKAGIDQHFENISKDSRHPNNMLHAAGTRKAKNLLPASPHLWLWYDFAYLKTLEEAKNLLTTPRDNTILTFGFAGILDIVRRSEFVAAGLYENKDGFALSIRMPAGRKGAADDVDLHLPRDPKIAGTLPLLEPKGVIFSHSFYLDLATFWKDRTKIMTAENAKDFENAIKQAGRFLPGSSFEKLFLQSGTHHRIVAANAPRPDYKIEPGTRLPAFAFVTSMREPAFGRSLEILVRGVAAFAGTQKIATKIFPEDGAFPGDDQNLRFNFMPTVAAVKDQYIFASTPDLCKELIDILLKEDRSKVIPQNLQMKVYAKGGGDFLNASPELLLTQTILSQAIGEADAKKQIEQLLKFAQKLGTVGIETDYAANEFRFDLKWKLNK